MEKTPIYSIYTKDTGTFYYFLNVLHINMISC